MLFSGLVFALCLCSVQARECYVNGFGEGDIHVYHHMVICSGLSYGARVGIAIAICAVVALVCLAFLLYLRRRRKQRAAAAYAQNIPMPGMRNQQPYYAQPPPGQPPYVPGYAPPYNSGEYAPPPYAYYAEKGPGQESGAPQPPQQTQPSEPLQPAPAAQQQQQQSHS